MLNLYTEQKVRMLEAQRREIDAGHPSLSRRPFPVVAALRARWRRATPAAAPLAAIALLREHVQAAHELLEEAIGDVTTAQSRWVPPGSARPLAASYLHTLLMEDLVVSGLRRQVPLFRREWAGRAGFSELPPLVEEQQAWAAWVLRNRLDLEAGRSYAGAVHASSEKCVGELAPSDLERTVDLSHLGFRPQRLVSLLTRAAATHVSEHAGEITCLKGLQRPIYSDGYC